jgi:hypothetical protein
LADYNESMKHCDVDLEELNLEISFGNELDPLLIGLFTSCRNIKKLTLNSYEANFYTLPQILRKMFTIFSQLEEIVIFSLRKTNQNQFFKIISDCCLNLKRLRLTDHFIMRAEKYFCNRGIDIIECQEKSDPSYYDSDDY